MKSQALALLLLASFLGFAQTATAPAVALTAEPHHHLILENEFVRVFEVEVLPNAETLLHQHDHDYAFVTLGDSEVENDVVGKSPARLKLADGESRFTSGKFAHVAKNLVATPFRNVTMEFLRDAIPASTAASDTALLPGERLIFDKDGVRATEIRLAAGASLPRHTHTHPHLVIAVSDLDMRSEAEGKLFSEVHRKIGEVAWVPGGLTHTVANVGTSEARYIALEFR